MVTPTSVVCDGRVLQRNYPSARVRPDDRAHKSVMSTVVFDFITDEDFRAGLESDFREMEVAAANEAWKAVHVLAGSIIEAVLADYLVAAGQSKPDPLGMSLADLIAACRKAGVLSQKTADLSAVVKSYRNLIHPGRAKRLKESVDADGSSVAQSLVAIIVREVAAGQQERYGFTAEQIVAKFESDPSALGISQHLLRDAKEREIERLLLKVLPGSYFSTLRSNGPMPRCFKDTRVCSGLRLTLLRFR